MRVAATYIPILAHRIAVDSAGHKNDRGKTGQACGIWAQTRNARLPGWQNDSRNRTGHIPHPPGAPHGRGVARRAWQPAWAGWQMTAAVWQPVARSGYRIAQHSG